MSSDYFADDLIMEVGRIGLVRGHLRASLLSAIDALVSSRIGDQGLGRLLLSQSDVGDLCEVLITIAQIRRIPQQIIEQLINTNNEYNVDFKEAIVVVNGMWTYIGGATERTYGLFEREVAIGGSLKPKWRKIKVDDLRQLYSRLNSALESLRATITAIRAACAQTKGET